MDNTYCLEPEAAQSTKAVSHGTTIIETDASSEAQVAATAEPVTGLNGVLPHQRNNQSSSNTLIATNHQLRHQISPLEISTFEGYSAVFQI